MECKQRSLSDISDAGQIVTQLYRRIYPTWGSEGVNISTLKRSSSYLHSFTKLASRIKPYSARINTSMPLPKLLFKVKEQRHQRCQGPFLTHPCSGQPLVCSAQSEDSCPVKTRQSENFRTHITNADWQHEQFVSLQKNLPEKCLLTISNFALSYSCFSQDEIRGAHWKRSEVTIHPVVAYYREETRNEV